MHSRFVRWFCIRDSRFGPLLLLPQVASPVQRQMCKRSLGTAAFIGLRANHFITTPIRRLAVTYNIDFVSQHMDSLIVNRVNEEMPASELSRRLRTTAFFIVCFFKHTGIRGKKITVTSSETVHHCHCRFSWELSALHIDSATKRCQDHRASAWPVGMGAATGIQFPMSVKNFDGYRKKSSPRPSVFVRTCLGNATGGTDKQSSLRRR